jgi:hypothetical protein
MKKNIFQISALVLILGLSFANCHSKSDNSLYQTNSLLLNYINGLLAGNCSVITKKDVAAGTFYEAQGTTIPSGGCNASTLGSTYTSTAATVIAKSDAYFDLVTAVFDKYPACSDVSSFIKGTGSTYATVLTGTNATVVGLFTGIVKTTTNATNLSYLINTSVPGVSSSTTSNAFNDATLRTGFHPKNCREVKIGLLYTAGVYCLTDAAATTASGNVKFNTVNSVANDMPTNFFGNRDILEQVNVSSVPFYTKTATNNFRMMTSAEVATLNSTTNSPTLDAYALTYITSLKLAAGGSATINGLTANASSTAMTALSTSIPGCQAALSSNNSTLKDYLTRIPFVYFVTVNNTNITFQDRNAVTTPFVPYLTCKYGAGYTASTSTVLSATASTPAEGFCPSSYTSF